MDSIVGATPALPGVAVDSSNSGVLWEVKGGACVPSEAVLPREDVGPASSTDVRALSGDTAVGVKTGLVPKSMGAPERMVVCVGTVA